MPIEDLQRKLEKEYVHFGFATICARPTQPITWAGLGGTVYTNRALALAAAKRLDFYIRTGKDA